MKLFTPISVLEWLILWYCSRLAVILFILLLFNIFNTFNVHITLFQVAFDLSQLLLSPVYTMQILLYLTWLAYSCMLVSLKSHWELMFIISPNFLWSCTPPFIYLDWLRHINIPIHKRRGAGSEEIRTIVIKRGKCH